MLAVEVGEYAKLPASCQHYGAGLEDARNMKKKWKKEGTLEAHVTAYKERQPALTPAATADRTKTLAHVVKQMAADLSVRQAVKVCQAQGVRIQKSALHKRKTSETLRDSAGAPPKLPPHPSTSPISKQSLVIKHLKCKSLDNPRLFTVVL